MFVIYVIVSKESENMYFKIMLHSGNGRLGHTYTDMNFTIKIFILKGQ